MLRIDLNLLWTVINVLIIFVIVKKFLLKPVNKILAARQEEIDRQYATAKEAEASKLNSEEQKAEMLKEARAKAGEEYQRIVADARSEADKILSDAKILADREQEKRMQQTQNQIAELVVAAAAKLVASKTSEEEDKELYNQFITKTGGLE